MSEALLRLADELERRDERAAAELGEVERLAADVERTGAAAREAIGFLDSLPDALAALAREQEAVAAARAEAEAALAEAESRERDARGEQETLTAARAVQHARDDLRDAVSRLERAQAGRARLEGEEAARRSEAAGLEREAAGLSERLAAISRVAHEAAAAPDGLRELPEWAARARGALLVAGAGLSSERDRVAREATELVASVSGDPLALAGARGVRERVARALSDG
ncbi:MAG TPA: hypothetical protein VFJ91_12940 [Gaiellaceae bacterium]|nr:hypothetical protein [Gaiellaceae bacterium]